jgi:DNA-binding NtrC family response regulator
MVDFFIQQTCAEMDIPPKPFSPGAIERLKHRAWPGNVRELQNVVRRALIFSTENEVTPGDITQVETNEQKRENSVENPRGEGLEPYNQAKERVLQKFSAEYVEHLMQETGGNISQAAKLGGLSRVALQKILRRTGVDPQRFREE